jgi:hypothetical protein
MKIQLIKRLELLFINLKKLDTQGKIRNGTF